MDGHRSSLRGVMIVPTGIGCLLGGDAAFNPGVKLISSVCEELIVNPNAVNASDINELPANSLYVEGSTIDRFLAGEVNLRRVKTHNRILMLVNDVVPASVNSMNAGVWGLGADVRIEQLRKPLSMRAEIWADGSAGGSYSGVEELVDQLDGRDDFDAVAIQTPISCSGDVADRYWRDGGVNPWGAVEAMVSRHISLLLNKPVAHAPLDTEFEAMHRSVVVARAMAPEIISNTYTFCVLKGLHRAPRIVNPACSGDGVLSKDSVDFLLTPHGCWGRPHAAAASAGVPIVVVRENRTCFSEGFQYPGAKIFFVDDYLQAAGLIACWSAGVDPRTVIVQCPANVLHGTIA